MHLKFLKLIMFLATALCIWLLVRVVAPPVSTINACEAREVYQSDLDIIVNITCGNKFGDFQVEVQEQQSHSVKNGDLLSVVVEGMFFVEIRTITTPTDEVMASTLSFPRDIRWMFLCAGTLAVLIVVLVGLFASFRLSSGISKLDELSEKIVQGEAKESDLIELDKLSRSSQPPPD